MAKKIKYRGYSLPEVLLALLFLTIAILAMVSLFVSGLKLKTRLSQVTVATELAHEVIERTKSMSFGELPPAGTSYDGSLPTPIETNLFPPAPYPSRAIGGRDYTIHMTVGAIAGRPRLRSILVEVTWGHNSSVKLATRMFDS